MAASAHAYMRGSTRRFYEWLEQADRVALPAGPPVRICGDCHVGNLGPIGSATGGLAIQIRDLDQTVIGNPRMILFVWDCRSGWRPDRPIFPVSSPRL
jgi:uncharacterized protein (DUF2252 family)